MGIRKLGENINKEAILYRMNAREKVDAERKWKRIKFSVANFPSKRSQGWNLRIKRVENCSNETNQTNPDMKSWELCLQKKAACTNAIEAWIHMIMKKFKEKFNLTLPKNESIHKLRNEIEHKKMLWNDHANKQPFRAHDLKNGYYNSPTIDPGERADAQDKACLQKVIHQRFVAKRCCQSKLHRGAAYWDSCACKLRQQNFK